MAKSTLNIERWPKIIVAVKLRSSESGDKEFGNSTKDLSKSVVFIYVFRFYTI